MKARVDNIIFQLAESEEPITAQELGQKLAICSRTVKSEMQEVRVQLEKIGAELVAKRNEGYSLRIYDREAFDNYYAQLVMHSSVINKYYAVDGQARFLYITRKMVSSSKYIRIEELTEEMYISRSALHKSLNEAMRFLKSFHLEWESRKGLGIHCFGKEEHVRLAMTELYAVHFHKSVLDNAGMEYSKWLECDYEERQDIRHNFLKTFRESGIRASDISTQKFSIYLLITRNRCKAGYRLWQKDDFKKEIGTTKEYAIAMAVFDNLKSSFAGFDLPEEEINFLAAYMLTLEDISYKQCMPEAHPEERFSLFYDQALKYARELIMFVREKLHIDLSVNKNAEYMLCAVMITVLAQFRYELNGFQFSRYHQENYIMESPIPLKVGRVMADYIQYREKREISGEILLKLNNVVFQVIAKQEYEIRKKKLLLANSAGVDANEMNAGRLMDRYSRLIESCTFAELYEIRGLDRREYDAVLLDMANVAYNYELPYAALHVTPTKKEMDNIFNKILVSAYQFREVLPEEEIIQTYPEFSYVNEQQFFQFISYKHCSSSETQHRMEEVLQENERYMTHCAFASQVAVLIGEYELTGKESIELYGLQQESLWSGEKIRHILYVCIDWKYDMKRVKAMENAICQLTSSVENIQGFMEDKKDILARMIYQYIKSA